MNLIGFYSIKSIYSEKVLAVGNTKVSNGTQIIQKTAKGTDDERWVISKATNGGYIISSKIGRLNIDVPDFKAVNGQKLQMHYSNGTTAQRFNITEQDKKLENGLYKIRTVLNNKPAFDIKDGSYSDGAKIQLWDDVNAKQQKFQITADSSGYYTIKSIYSNKVLAVASSKVNKGDAIIQKTAKGTDDEKWSINFQANDQYTITSKIGNLNIDVPDFKAVNGQRLQMFYNNGATAQKFTFVKTVDNTTTPTNYKTIENGIYEICMYTKNSIALDVDYGKRDNCTNVQLWDWAGEKSYQQQFKFEYDSSRGTYTIYNVNSGKVLDVQGGGKTAGTNVWQYESNGTDAQRWFVEKNKDGSYSIKSKLNGLYLDVQNGKIANGKNIQVYTGNGTNAQKFNLVKQTDKAIRYIADGAYRIATKPNSNIGFDIKDGSKSNGAIIQLWDYVNASQEEFHIYYEDGYYYISSLYSNKVIKAKNKYEAIVQEEKNKNDDSQKWILKPNGNTFNIISKKTGLYIDVTDAKYKNGTKIQTFTGNGNNAQLFYIKDVAVVIDENKYPGIKDRLGQLKIQHPNWKFEILYTNLNFNTVIDSEYNYAGKQGNLVYTPTYKGAWIAPSPYVSGSWASASYKGIAYFMDTRNFLNNVDIFQFLDLSDYSSSGVTLESIQYQVNGTFLEKYAKDVMNACKNTNINPYYVLARLFQEQGRNGSSTLYMNGQDGNLYYNPFNIGAQVGNDYQTALARAKKEGWNTMAKGIEGGIRIIKSYYIDKKQNTLYLNKFDVNPASGGGFYNHQYMQNLSAAYSEARILQGAYEDANVLNNSIKFIIPVYENMPKTVSPKP